MRHLAAIFLFMTGSASACTIPVFRYALDRWDADKFHLVLPSSVAKDASVTELLRPIRANGNANLDIETSKDSTLLQPELRFSNREQTPLWSDTLDKASLTKIIDSPVRKQIVEHILAGDSIVWVIADRGTSEDEVVVQHLEKRLKFLEQVASLPIQNPNDPDSQLGPGPPLKLKFTLLRFRSDDPAEAAFVKMLAGPIGHIDPAKTSYAAAVFGRGRVLGAWPLEDLTDTALEDASMFLVGRCSCRLKNENPGWDILMNVDWGKSLVAVTENITSENSPTIPQPANLTQTVESTTKTDEPSIKSDISTATLIIPQAKISTFETSVNFPRTTIALTGIITSIIGLAWLGIILFRRKNPS